MKIRKIVLNPDYIHPVVSASSVQERGGVFYGLEIEEPGQARTYYKDGFNVNDNGNGEMEVIDFDSGETVEEYRVDKEGRLDGEYYQMSSRGDILKHLYYNHGVERDSSGLSGKLQKNAEQKKTPEQQAMYDEALKAVKDILGR